MTFCCVSITQSFMLKNTNQLTWGMIKNRYWCRILCVTIYHGKLFTQTIFNGVNSFGGMSLIALHFHRKVPRTNSSSIKKRKKKVLFLFLFINFYKRNPTKYNKYIMFSCSGFLWNSTTKLQCRSPELRLTNCHSQ